MLTLCVLAACLSLIFQLVIGFQSESPTPALKLFRGSQIALVLVLFFLAWRKAGYRTLDHVLLIFAGFVVCQTVLLQDIADPEKMGLLGRNMAVLAIGHMLLPTRFLFSNYLMALMAGLSLIQIVVFFHLGLNEKLVLAALIVCLSVAGIMTRWRREVTNRRRYRATRERDNLVTALRDSEQRMRLVTDNMPAFIAYTDNQQILRFTNRTGMEWFKLKPADVIGQNIKQILGAGYEGGRAKFEAALQGKAVRYEWAMPFPDGTTRNVEIHHLPHKNEQGDVLGFFSQIFDITNIKQSEQKLKKARHAAEAANRTKSQFLANMSHELRTPLNAVIGFSQVMQTGLTGDLNEKQMEYLADISNSGEHLLSLINDLMDLAKIEAGKLEIFPEEIQIQAQIEDCLPFVREQAEAAGIELRFIAAHGLPPLFADPRMLRQMLVNLLTNAVKFSPPGSVVSITGDCPEAGGLVISVQDQGVGMAPEDIPKAMTPFGQTESGMHAGGTGLGLPLVREMMTLHDGTLEISSVKGEGTIASLCFPLAQVETRRLRQS